MRDAGYRYPNKANGLHKRKDDGNVKPIEIERLQAFLSAIDRKKLYRPAGLCNYYADAGYGDAHNGASSFAKFRL